LGWYGTAIRDYSIGVAIERLAHVRVEEQVARDQRVRLVGRLIVCSSSVTAAAETPSFRAWVGAALETARGPQTGDLLVQIGLVAGAAEATRRQRSTGAVVAGMLVQIPPRGPKKKGGPESEPPSKILVAGAGFEPATFGL
jgi:hypothetical protein